MLTCLKIVNFFQSGKASPKQLDTKTDTEKNLKEDVNTDNEGVKGEELTREEDVNIIKQDEAESKDDTVIKSELIEDKEIVFQVNKDSEIVDKESKPIIPDESTNEEIIRGDIKEDEDDKREGAMEAEPHGGEVVPEGGEAVPEGGEEVQVVEEDVQRSKVDSATQGDEREMVPERKESATQEG